MNKNCGIYKITSPTGRVYIGQSRNLKRRLTEYKLKSKVKYQPRIIYSFDKHGVEKHQFDIIEYCSEEQLNCSERFWQDEFDVLGKDGLNCYLQECGKTFRINSEETTRKLSEANKGQNNSNYGKKWSEEWKMARSIAKKENGSAKGENNPMYGKESAMKGRKHTDTSLKLMSSKQKGGLNPAAKLVICIETGIFYDCVRQAAETFGYKRHTLSARLRGDLKNNTTLRYA